jgi:N-acetylated-alpha-linked acidic dipeptidase
LHLFQVRKIGLRELEMNQILGTCGVALLAGTCLQLAALPSPSAQKAQGPAQQVDRPRGERADLPAAIRGFAASRVDAERRLEQKLRHVPDAEHAEADLRQLTAEPHMAGTEASHRTAEWLREKYRSYGFEAELASYSVWLPVPVEEKLELVKPEKKVLATPEEPFEGDKDTHDRRAVRGFNAYSPSGEVTSSVVYVNYGMPEDYRQLDDLGVKVEGKVVIARYGQGYRGVKAKLAEEHKAAALLIYSDPADDGYAAGDPYPHGPWRPMSGIQRGSILYTSIYPGDPLTPGAASTPDAKRLAPAEARTLPRIPTLPINAQDAAAILPHLGGAQVPHGWQGGLPFTYHVGSGQATVHLKLTMDYQQRTLYDVIARLRGSDDDEWVVLGNHHDAWVFGAVDPSSGTTVMLETARALGELARSGWKPRRTIVMCEWDGEEPGLIGSTEWVEGHLSDLQSKAVAYINTDVGVAGGDFNGSATPSLKDLVREVTRDVADPRAGRSVYEVWKERVARNGSKPSGMARSEPRAGQGPDVPMSALGAGSDFCPFLDHAGIPSIDVGFSGPYGVYHALYDDFYWMKHFGDPSFAYHASLARVLGTIALRLGEADVLPFDYEAYAVEIGNMAGDIEKRSQEAGAAQASLQAVVDAAAALKEAASRAGVALKSIPGSRLDAARANDLNRALVSVEQAFLAPDGLAGRPWYKHTLYAPGSYTGYAAVEMPGVSEALDRKDAETVRREAASVVEGLRRATARLDEVARLAKSAAQAAQTVQ